MVVGFRISELTTAILSKEQILLEKQVLSGYWAVVKTTAYLWTTVRLGLCHKLGEVQRATP